jgi:hypothetical protein
MKVTNKSIREILKSASSPALLLAEKEALLRETVLSFLIPN